MDPDASYAAWRHEYRHFLDDQASGWRGFDALTDSNTRWAWERAAYAEEIRVVRRAGHLEVVDEIGELRTLEQGPVVGQTETKRKKPSMHSWFFARWHTRRDPP